MCDKCGKRKRYLAGIYCRPCYVKIVLEPYWAEDEE